MTDTLKERFERYRKDQIVSSKPQDYIHCGLNPAAQFSDLIKDIRTEIERALKAVVPGELEAALDKLEVDTFQAGWNNCRVELLANIEKYLKEL